MQAVSNFIGILKSRITWYKWRWSTLPLVIGFLGVCLVFAAIAGVPQPMVVYYGQARDGFGWPYRQNAEVILYANETEVYRYAIKGSLKPGINFLLQAFLDDGTGAERYSRQTVKATDTITIKVRDQYGLQTLVETNAIPPAASPGDIHKIFITAGDDSDGDGLSDQWEREMIDWLNDPAIQTLADIRPEDDSDHDGSSNLHEYHTGTFAFLDYDYFGLRAMTPVLPERMRIDILSVPGKRYTVEQTDDIVSPNWQSVSFAVDEVSPMDYTELEGNGDGLSFYVTVDGPQLQYFRVFVE